jgi:hypothetical protein
VPLLGMGEPSRFSVGPQPPPLPRVAWRGGRLRRRTPGEAGRPGQRIRCRRPGTGTWARHGGGPRLLGCGGPTARWRGPGPSGTRPRLPGGQSPTRGTGKPAAHLRASSSWPGGRRGHRGGPRPCIGRPEQRLGAPARRAPTPCDERRPQRRTEAGRCRRSAGQPPVQVRGSWTGPSGPCTPPVIGWAQVRGDLRLWEPLGA